VIVIDWYVLRTICGKEEVALRVFQKMFSEVEVIYPRRRISWRKQGSIISLVRPLFEGYLFIATEKEKIREYSRILRMNQLNVAWLVYSAGSLVPIFTEEKQLIQQLMGAEGIVEVSAVERYSDRLQVVNGPLLGQEHIITKVSGRNRRITIEIPVLEEKKKIELEGIIINLDRTLA
jgi:transcription termination/antitermination protein NusG